MSALERALGPGLPPSITGIDDEVQDRLLEQIRTARQRQDAEIDRAVAVALKGVPLPLRRVVRKAVLG